MTWPRNTEFENGTTYYLVDNIVERELRYGVDLDQTLCGVRWNSSHLNGHAWRWFAFPLAAVSRINAGTPVRENQEHFVRNAAVAFHPG